MMSMRPVYEYEYPKIAIWYPLFSRLFFFSVCAGVLLFVFILGFMLPDYPQTQGQQALMDLLTKIPRVRAGVIYSDFPFCAAVMSALPLLFGFLLSILFFFTQLKTLNVCHPLPLLRCVLSFLFSIIIFCFHVFHENPFECPRGAVSCYLSIAKMNKLIKVSSSLVELLFLSMFFGFVFFVLTMLFKWLSKNWRSGVLDGRDGDV